MERRPCLLSVPVTVGGSLARQRLTSAEACLSLVHSILRNPGVHVVHMLQDNRIHKQQASAFWSTSMNVSDLPAMTKPLLARGIGVSVTRVDRALQELEATGRLTRTKSPTGRETLTPRQAQLVTDMICRA